MQTYINPLKQNNDHTRIMRKVRFNSFFNSLTFKIVYYYHVTYKFQSESTLKVCLNVKELLAPSRTASEFESNEIRAHNRTVHK